MLHLGTGSSDVFRMHNAFLSLEEIDAIMGHIVDQPNWSRLDRFEYISWLQAD